MVSNKDYLQFGDVISQTYLVPIDKVDLAIQTFLTEIAQHGMRVNGRLFYSLRASEDRKLFSIELFMPVQNVPPALPENMQFHSYYSVDNVLTVCVSKDYETAVPAAYEELRRYMAEHNLREVTPAYHIIGGDDTLQYMFIKIGCAPQ